MILPDQPEAEYHAHPAISRSALWILATQTPKHFHNRRPKKSKAMDLGAATHIAVLQPWLLEESVIKGPDDRRGNKWKDVCEYSEAYGKIPLTSGDYDKAMWIREAAQEIPELRAITAGGQLIENSAYWIDEETQIECRVRPDIFHPELKIMADLKTASSAAEFQWSRSSGDYGYHLQEAMYSEGWEKAGGGEVDGFFFIVAESEFPFCVALYEHVPSAIIEGRAVMRKALMKYSICDQTNCWPGYPAGIQPIDIPRYAYRETVKNAEQ